MKTLLLSAASYLTLANGLPAAATQNGMIMLFLRCSTRLSHLTGHLFSPSILSPGPRYFDSSAVKFPSYMIQQAYPPGPATLPGHPQHFPPAQHNPGHPQQFYFPITSGSLPHPPPPCLRVIWMRWLLTPSIRLIISARDNPSCSLTSIMTSTTTAEDTPC